MRILFCKSLAGFFLLLAPALLTAQLNMVLQDSVTYTGGVNDICGWASPDGKEYAIIGLHGGVAIVDVDVTPLQQVAYVPTEYNLWKDINTYGHYAYVSTEAQVGLLIIDLQYLPDSVKTYVWQDSLPTSDGPKPFKKAHTLWTDENGLLYLMGTNLNSGGVIMLDVNATPTDPQFLGYGPAIYSHDCYTRDSIIYSAEIYAGDLSIYDAHDPQNMVLLGRVKTPHEFTHNAWLSDNGKTMFTTDERGNSFVTSYDITDPGNIIELDRYRQASTEGSGNIVHNVYVWKEDWLVVAYYANGTTIVDAARPDNLVEVGNFDSFLGEDGGFPGVWGSYPWLPSGKILSSDRNTGLYVFEPTYVRACYLEGTVVDSVTGAPLENAVVSIISSEVVKPQASRIDGVFKMGKAVPGQYNITVTKEGYYSKTFAADFINGEILAPVIRLRQIPLHQVSGRVIYDDGNIVPFAKVNFFGEHAYYETTCDADGEFFLPEVYQGTYELNAGVWGHTHESLFELDETRDFTIQLKPGYRDNFDLDLGWVITGDAESGIWSRRIPVNQLLFENYICSSTGDSPNDIGGFAYTTGGSASEDVQDDEVSGGTTLLISPAMDLTQSIDPRIAFDFWLCEFPPNQYGGMKIMLTNSIDTILVDSFANPLTNGSWQSRVYDVDFETGLDNINFIVSASDTTSGESDYTLKVHLDKFRLLESGLSSEEITGSGKSLNVYPNPVYGNMIYLKKTSETPMDISTIRFYDLQGRLLSSQVIQADQQIISLEHQLEEGLYFLQWQSIDGAIGTHKIIVVR